MRRVRLLGVGVVLAATLVGCSSDDGSDGAAATTGASVVAATAASTDGTGTADEPSGPDIDPACLDGLWTMAQPELERFVQASYPLPRLTVPLGSATLEFIGKQVVFTAQFRLDLQVGDVDLQTDADFKRIGDVTVSGDDLDLAFGTAQGGIQPFQEIAADGSTAEAPIAPTLDPPDLRGTGVTCTDTELSFPESNIGVPGPFVFTRSPG